MIYQLENDFHKHIKSAQLHRVYLLHGTQPYLIGLYEKLLVKKAVGGDANAFNLHRFEGETLDLQAFYDAVESLPLFAENRCVTLDLDPDKLDSGQFSELLSVLGDPPLSTTVVITVKTPPSKKERMTQLIKVCSSAGASMEFGARRGSGMSTFLRDRAQKNGCSISGENASYLAGRCADDMQLLSQEMDKLCAYAAGREITRADIDEVVTPVLQARVYDLSKAILRGSFDRALELIDQLLYLREPAPRILAALSGAFCDLYRGFAARQAGVPAEQAAKELGYAKNRVFAIKNAMSDSGGYTAAQLGGMLILLAEADARLKSTGTSERVVLEQTVARLFMLAQKGDVC